MSRAPTAPSTASSARARTRTGRACRSQRLRANGELRVVVGAVAGTPAALPDACALASVSRSAASRGRDRTPLRGGDRADLRRARLGRLPAARDRRRGAARPRAAGGRGVTRIADGLRAVLDGTAALLPGPGAAGDAARAHPALALSARARSSASTPRPCPAGAVVLTPDGRRAISPAYGCQIRDQTVLALDRARFAGDPVAAVAAETPEQAEEALALIDVEYEELPAVLDLEQALDGAVLVHERHPGLGQRRRLLRHAARSRARTSATASGSSTATSSAASSRPTSSSRRPSARRPLSTRAMEPHACLARWEGERLERLDGHAHAVQRPRGPRRGSSGFPRSRCASSARRWAARSARRRSSTSRRSPRRSPARPADRCACVLPRARGVGDEQPPSGGASRIAIGGPTRTGRSSPSGSTRRSTRAPTPTAVRASR